MKFEIYKRGQGKHTRLWSGLGGGLVVALGCLALYKKLEGSDLNLWVTIMVPAGLFVVFSYVIFWLLNKPAIADFMIESEGEMKKVNWSSRREIAVSTLIVICVVIIMAVLLGVTDLGFQLFFQWLLG